ncbi:hypothetical protein CWI39_0700p0010 [Hamiltosporidium magnivora]|uniref:Uncharacterized protein n=1 Tax=Hamiltosporidium magnivora TaxID=148818 RepID=A0A4Q9LBR4_9MICR|nr:hypothetical protein CWI39_0700p0010 [Hamiltosporidium magnivora]
MAILDSINRNNRAGIFILDKKKNKITLIEVGITSQDPPQIVETVKLRKYDLLANYMGLIYKFSVKTIPCVMTWKVIVIKTIGHTPKNCKYPSIAPMGVVERADMLEKPKILLKQGIKKVDEPTLNLNEESNLEEEKIVVKKVEGNL